jgi:hypothetical protein
MKLSFKLGGLCGSGAFLVTATPVFFQYVLPLSFLPDVTDTLHSLDVFESLGISLLGSVLIGAIGYIIGDILSNPNGEPHKPTTASPAKPNKAEKPGPPVTGDEIFLNDAGLSDPLPLPDDLPNLPESPLPSSAPDTP